MRLPTWTVNKVDEIVCWSRRRIAQKFKEAGATRLSILDLPKIRGLKYSDKCFMIHEYLVQLLPEEIKIKKTKAQSKYSYLNHILPLFFVHFKNINKREYQILLHIAKLYSLASNKKDFMKRINAYLNRLDKKF